MLWASESPKLELIEKETKREVERRLSDLKAKSDELVRARQAALEGKRIMSQLATTVLNQWRTASAGPAQ